MNQCNIFIWKIDMVYLPLNNEFALLFTLSIWKIDTVYLPLKIDFVLLFSLIYVVYINLNDKMWFDTHSRIIVS